MLFSDIARKSKIENQYANAGHGRARPFIFAILSGRLIATRRPDSPDAAPTPYLDLDIECRRYCFLLFVAVSVSVDIERQKAKSERSASFLVIKFNMRGVYNL